jgi:hypothetical protein
MRIPLAIVWPGHVDAGATDEPVAGDRRRADDPSGC